MAKRRGPAGGRGSPEAVAKRRAARQLNTLLGANQIRPGLDGRTEKRRQRLIKELKEGRRGTALKPIDVVAHVNELMDLGESIASLKKLGVKPRKVEATSEILAIVDRTQEAYGFRAEAWRMLGLKVEGAPGGGGRRRKKA
jgi:hypothetical protein